MSTEDSHQYGATVVITHRVHEGHQTDYEHWLEEISRACRAAPGHLDWQIIRPIAGLTGSYTVVIRFDTKDHLRQWMESPARKQHIEQAGPILAESDDYSIHSGLDFWFMPQGAKARIPVRWKQFLITWSAIYPLVMLVPLLIVPAMHSIGLPENRPLTTLFVTATVVFLMVYLVMPRYTRLVRHWLFD